MSLVEAEGGFALLGGGATDEELHDGVGTLITTVPSAFSEIPERIKYRNYQNHMKI